MMRLNGENTDFSGTLKQLLELKGYREDRVAAEINGQIIKKSDYETVRIKSGDRVEIVRFVGGG